MRIVKSKNSSKKSFARSLEEIEMILDNIPGLVFYKDDKNRFIWVNKYIAEAYKTKREDLIGKSLFELYPEDIAQKYYDDDLEVIKSKKSKLNFIEPWDVAEGRRWVNSNKIPLYDDDGKCIGIIGFSTDVTEQVKTEQKLKKAHEQLNTIFSNLKDTVFVISEDFKILYKNENAHSVFGEDLVGRNCFEVIKGQDQTCERCPIKILAETDLCQVHFEQTINTPFLEEERFFDIISSPIESYAGQPAIVEVLRDITARKKAEEINLKLAAIVENSDDAIIGKTLDGIINSWNKGAERIYNYASKEIIGKPISILVPSDRHDEVQGILDRIKAGDSIDHFETVRVRKDGEEIKISLTISPIKDITGNIIGASTIARNITERKQLEKENARKTAITEAVKEIFQMALTTETDEEIAMACLEETQKLTRSKFGYIGEINQEGKFDTIALSNPGWDICRIPKSEAVVLIQGMEIKGYWGKAITERVSVIVNDPTLHPDAQGTPEGHPPITSFLGVPMKQAGHVIGLIGIANKEGGYDLHDQEAVETLSVALVEALMRKRAEIELEKHRNQLDSLVQERTKELNCLYELSKIIEEKGLTKEDIIEKTTNIIPSAWQFPDVTCARIQVENKEYKTKNFKETKWKQSSDILVNDIKIGLVEVYYLEKLPDCDEGPFLKEERYLIDAITERLGKNFERLDAELKVKESEDIYRTIINSLADPLYVVDRNLEILLINPTLEIWLEDLGIKKVIIGQTIFEAFPFLSNEIRKEYEQIFDTGEIQYTEGSTFINGKEIITETRRIPLFKEGHVNQVLVIMRDITERKRAEQKEHVRVIIMNSINQIFQNALTCENEEELGKICLEIAQELSGAKIGFFGDVNKEGKFDMIAISNPGWDECKIPGTEASKILKGMEIRGILFPSLKDSKSHIFKNPSNHPDSIGAPKGHPKITSFLTVPLKYNRKVIGQIGLGNKPGGFNHQDQEVIEALSITMIEALMHRRAEDKLRESEERFRMIFESKLIGTIFWNAEGEITDANEAFLDMVGYTKEEVLNGIVRWKDMTPLEYLERDEKLLKELATNGYISPFEKEYYHKDGHRIPIVLGASTLPGSTVNGVAFVLDITERRKVEQKIKESEEKFRTLAEQSIMGIIIFQEGLVKYANKAVAEIVDYPLEEMKKWVIPDIFTQVHPEDLPMIKENFKKREGNANVELEYYFRVITKSGEIRWIYLISKPIIYQGAEATFAIAQNITARKNAEQKALKQTNTIKSINKVFEKALTTETELELGQTCLNVAQKLSGARFGFFGEVNKEGKFEVIAMSNPGWEECKIPGYESTNIIKDMEICGMLFLSLKDGKSRIINDPLNHPDIVTAPDGHTEIYNLLTIPFKYKDKIIGTIGLGNKPGGFNHHDQEAIETLSIAMIEALMKKRVEENIKKSEENLKVSNVSLRKAMKELKRSNAELEQFAYVSSHDLQEPLRMVASFTQLLQKRYQDKLDDDANDFINYAVEGATRMQNLISDLLIFSRVGTRGKPFKITDMNAVIETVLNIIRQLINESSTEVTYEPLPVVLADESQMIQLVQNLISNAIKFRGEETPRIHISGEVKADKWIFSVSDNGIGMESKYFDRIFVIFQRLHKRDKYGGTGIGLAVCKKIIQRHSGKIWVESELGKGSSFHFTIKKHTQDRNSV